MDFAPAKKVENLTECLLNSLLSILSIVYTGTLQLSIGMVFFRFFSIVEVRRLGSLYLKNKIIS